MMSSARHTLPTPLQSLAALYALPNGVMRACNACHQTSPCWLEGCHKARVLLVAEQRALSAAKETT